MENKIKEIEETSLYSNRLGEAAIDYTDDMETLLVLQDYYSSDATYDGRKLELVKEHIDFLKQKTSSKPTPLNRPIKTLLSRIKKGKFTKEDVREVKRRFSGLNHADQVAAIDIFLSMPVLYRRWCYVTLRDWREPLFDDKLLSLWLEKKEQYCRRTLVQVLPEEKMKDVITDFLDDINYTDFKILLTRFGKKEWFPSVKDIIEKFVPYNVDDEYFMFFGMRSLRFCNRYKYLWLFSLTNETVPPEIYMTILSDCVYRNLEHLASRDMKDLPTKRNYVLYYSIADIKLYDFHSINDHLVLLLRMGLQDFVIRFVSWMNYVNKLLPDLLLFAESSDIENYNNRRFYEYYSLLVKTMPKSMEDLENFPLCTAQEIIDQRTAEIEALERKGQYEEYSEEFEGVCDDFAEMLDLKYKECPF